MQVPDPGRLCAIVPIGPVSLRPCLRAGYQASVVWLYKNLLDCGDCHTSLKSQNTTRFVDRSVGLEIAGLECSKARCLE